MIEIMKFPFSGYTGLRKHHIHTCHLPFVYFERATAQGKKITSQIKFLFLPNNKMGTVANCKIVFTLI